MSRIMRKDPTTEKPLDRGDNWDNEKILLGTWTEELSEYEQSDLCQAVQRKMLWI